MTRTLEDAYGGRGGITSLFPLPTHDQGYVRERYIPFWAKIKRLNDGAP